MVSKDNQPRVGAIIVAAGASHRMAGVDKVFAMLAGEPLIKYSLLAFQEVQGVDTGGLVLSDAQLERGYHLVDGAGLTILLPRLYLRKGSTITIRLPPFITN